MQKYLTQGEVPTLIRTDLKPGELKPNNALLLVIEIIKNLISCNEKPSIALLSFFVETTKVLQKSISNTIGYQKNLLIETVSRIQGLTTDVAVYVIPNVGYHRSLEKRLFNVATSRSKRHTILIVDKNILNVSHIDNDVKVYLQKLNKEFSFEFQIDNLNSVKLIDTSEQTN